MNEDDKGRGETETTKDKGVGSSGLLCFYVVFKMPSKYAWRITLTKKNLNIAKELEEWICDTEKIEGEDIALINWKQLEAYDSESTVERFVIKPCPFCGGEGYLTDEYMDSWSVYCGDCEAGTTQYIKQDDAISHWNRRA